MKTSPESIRKFKALYLKHFGELLSDKEALEQIHALLVITELGLPPIPSQYKAPPCNDV